MISSLTSVCSSVKEYVNPVVNNPTCQKVNKFVTKFVAFTVGGAIAGAAEGAAVLALLHAVEEYNIRSKTQELIRQCDEGRVSCNDVWRHDALYKNAAYHGRLGRAILGGPILPLLDVALPVLFGVAGAVGGAVYGSLSDEQRAKILQNIGLKKPDQG